MVSPLLVLALLAAEPAPLPEGNAFVKALVGKQRRREEILNGYTYDALETEERLSASGAPASRKTRSHEIFYVKGQPVRRLVAEDSVPLDPERQAREDLRVQELARRVRERGPSAEDVELRLSLILDRYDFRTVGREDAGGRSAIVLEFAPRAGKRGLPHDNVLRSLAGRIWVDEEQEEVVRAEIRNTAGIKFALGIGAVVSTVQVAIQFRRMPEGIWLPEQASFLAEGRILLFKKFRRRTTETYTRFRRFEVDSEETVAPHPPRP